MTALERCLHADAGLPGFSTDMAVLRAGGDRGGRGGGGLRRCCSGAEVEQREVMRFNADRCSPVGGQMWRGFGKSWDVCVGTKEET